MQTDENRLQSTPLRVVVVAGARPNFMKIAPLMHELRQRPRFDARLVHTGQHYDEAMSKSFFVTWEFPSPMSISGSAREATPSRPAVS